MAFDFQTSNPTLSADTFARARAEAGDSVSFRERSIDRGITNTMTLEGTVLRTSILVILLLITATFSWSQMMAEIGAGQDNGAVVTPRAGLFAIGGVLGGLLFALITSFAPRMAPYTAPLYALAEGLALGTISAIFENQYHGIVVNAVGLTIGTLIMLLAMYATGMIRATPMFQRIVVAATGGIFMVYMASMILRLFGIDMPFLHSTGPIGIGISLVVVVVAALNLVLDFNLIEQGTRQGAPRFMEWYGGFALLVTLVWLYLELLRLLSLLNRRD